MKLDSGKMAFKIVEILDEKKAQNIDLLDIKDVSLLADYFVICSGNSATQIKALSDAVEEKLGEIGYFPKHKEGYSSARWILLDYGEVVVHIFHHESRAFYNLERLWSDAQHVDIESIVNRV